jgi:hypothetical protein
LQVQTDGKSFKTLVHGTTVASTVLFPLKKILNIDKYFACESRDMSDESGTYIILLKLKTILLSWR